MASSDVWEATGKALADTVKLQRLDSRQQTSTQVPQSAEERERRQLVDRIAHLENDIVELENELESLDEDGGRMATDEIINHLLMTSNTASVDLEGGEDVEKAESEQQNLTTQLRSLAAFTGITFESKTSAIVERDDGPEPRRVRHVELAGHSFGVRFAIDFDVVASDLRVVDLHVHLPDDALAEIGAAFVENVQRRALLLPLLQTLVAYAELRQQRRHLFEHVRERFGDTILLPHGTTGALLHIVSSSPYVFTWLLHVTPAGRVQSAISLANPTGNTLAPFDAAVRSCGLAQALCAVVQAAH